MFMIPIVIIVSSLILVVTVLVPAMSRGPGRRRVTARTIVAVAGMRHPNASESGPPDESPGCDCPIPGANTRDKRIADAAVRTRMAIKSMMVEIDDKLDEEQIIHLT